MKQRAWDLILSRTGKIVTLVIGLSVIGAGGVKTHQYFAKTWQVVRNEVRLDKNDLVMIQQRIFELEIAREERELSIIERQRLFQLYEQQTDIRDGIKLKQRSQ